MKIVVLVVLLIILKNIIESSNINVKIKRIMVDLLMSLTNCCLQINQAIRGSHGLDVQFIGVNFLESLVMVSFYCFWYYIYRYTIWLLIISSSQVSEFSPSTSSAMGLPREFHENCRKSLEQNFLKVTVGLHLLPVINPSSFRL
jgi:hypothetical protein